MATCPHCGCEQPEYEVRITARDDVDWRALSLKVKQTLDDLQRRRGEPPLRST